MENLNKDMLFKLAIELEFSDLLKLCASGKQINEKICNNDSVWFNKLNRDFPSYKDTQWNINPIEIYRLFYFLEVKCGKNHSINIISNSGTLILSYKKLKRIPKGIGQLQNLENLLLHDNKLTLIPKEVGQLKNLNRLDVDSNRLTEIPKEIGQNFGSGPCREGEFGHGLYL